MLSSFGFIGSVITLGAFAGIVYLIRKIVTVGRPKTNEKN